MNMDSGMPLQTAYRYLMQDTFKNVHRVDYDGDFLAMLEQQAAKNPFPVIGITTQPSSRRCASLAAVVSAPASIRSSHGRMRT